MNTNNVINFKLPATYEISKLVKSYKSLNPYNPYQNYLFNQYDHISNYIVN